MVGHDSLHQNGGVYNGSPPLGLQQASSAGWLPRSHDQLCPQHSYQAWNCLTFNFLTEWQNMFLVTHCKSWCISCVREMESVAGRLYWLSAWGWHHELTGHDWQVTSASSPDYIVSQTTHKHTLVYHDYSVSLNTLAVAHGHHGLDRVI